MLAKLHNIFLLLKYYCTLYFHKQALVVDMKTKLLSALKELMDQGMKIQSLQAWGWFIRLLGPCATKNKHLVNEMLKLLEKTFSDSDSSSQIASLVSLNQKKSKYHFNLRNFFPT